QSGHIIMSDHTTTGDGLLAAFHALSVVRKAGKPASDIFHQFEPLPQILKNVRTSAGKPLENTQVIRAIEAATQRLGAEGRLVIRPSGTEPVIRVMAEGDDRALVESVVDDVIGALRASAAA